jgi:hypothetical protein
MILVLYFILPRYVYGSHPLCHLAEKMTMNGGCCHLNIKKKLKLLQKERAMIVGCPLFFILRK